MTLYYDNEINDHNNNDDNSIDINNNENLTNNPTYSSSYIKLGIKQSHIVNDNNSEIHNTLPNQIPTITTKTENIWNEIERKWIEYWEKNEINISDPDHKKEKFFLTVAYPYPNSPQHIGHGRTYTLADVHARYFKLKGFNVLFPMGFHYTGSPILGMSKRVKSKDIEIIQNFKKIYEIDQETIESFEDPLKIAKYFHNEIRTGMKEMGYAIDWRREFTTIDKVYQKLISWQFNTLKNLGVIEQGSHPVGWCPNDENPVSQHDTLGDVEPSFTEYLFIKFKVVDKNLYLPVATLRPETIFGVTNLWINPDEDYLLVLINNSEQWILSRDAVEKLKFLNYSTKILQEKILGSSLTCHIVKNPLTDKQLPVLPASFVTMDDGSGIVMSVPAHAPFDMQALIDFKNKVHNTLNKSEIGVGNVDNISPLKIIDSDISKYNSAKSKSNAISKSNTDVDAEVIPSEFFLKKYNIKNQIDKNLEKATSDLYSIEYYNGIMNENTPFSGIAVSKAKDLVKEKLLELNISIPFYELTNKPVFCRCGSLCYVKILNNQWFLNYGNHKWKDLALKCLDNMEILPEEIIGEFKNVFDWLKERACARKSGLGTLLPWDKEWIIESLSDSVIYMVYYIIAKYVNTQNLEKFFDLIDDSFFDYVLSNKKTGCFKDIDENRIKKSMVEEFSGDTMSPTKEKFTLNEFLRVSTQIKNEFEYYYPLDSRHSGRDLVPNHLSFFIFNHAILFPQKYWPKQIIVNGSVLMDGKKMSKSMGNIVPLRKTIKQYNADSIRVAMLVLGELLQDVDFSFSILKGIHSKLNELFQFYITFYTDNKKEVDSFLSIPDKYADSKDNKNDDILIHKLTTNKLCSEDKWLLSRVNNIIDEVTNSFDSFKIRDALNHVLYLMEKDFDWFRKRKNTKKNLKFNYNGNESYMTDVYVIYQYLSIRLKLLSPFCPFLAEEIYQSWGNKGSIFKSIWPKPISAFYDPVSEEREQYIQNTMNDLEKITKITKNIKPSEIFIYIASENKKNLYQMILKIMLTIKNKNFGEIMKNLLFTSAENEEMQKFIKSNTEFIKKTIEDILSLTPAQQNRKVSNVDFNEFESKEDLIYMISSELGISKESIFIYCEDEKEIVDPNKKSKFSRPFKPAIFLR